MKKTILSVIATIAIITASNAQKDVKYEKLYYKDLTQENSDVAISVNNAVSTKGETKFLLKITNKTGDYIIYKPQESKFVINGKEISPTEKLKIIEPNDFRTVTVNIKGAGYNEIKNYSFIVDGLYKVSADAKGLQTPDFKLPASNNDFKTGGFSCNLSSSTKESNKTEAKFKCAYNGDKVGFISPAKASVRMPDNKEYANDTKKGGAIILVKGETDSFTLKWNRMEGGKAMDMQLVEMNIVWHDTFAEVTPEKMKPETLAIEFDEVTSNSKK